MSNEQLREAVAWCRTFIKHAQNELCEAPNDHVKVASELHAILDQYLLTSTSSCLHGETL